MHLTCFVNYLICSSNYITQNLTRQKDLFGLDLKVFHTPGHSPGSVCLYWTQQKALFSGDLVFKEGIGRTDLPGGDGAKLKESIKKLVNLEIDWLFPGHGNMISGKEEVRSNFNEIENFWFKHI